MADQQQTTPAAQPLTGYRGIKHNLFLPSFFVSLSDLAKLFRELQEKTTEAVELQVRPWTKQANQTDEQFEASLKEARRVSKLMVIIIGTKGEQIVDYTEDALTSVDVPDGIRSITFDSGASYAYRFGSNYQLQNRLKLTLDFSEPSVLRNHNAWQQPTPNDTSFEIVGNNKTWVTAVRSTVEAFFHECIRYRKWLHSHIVFAALNWLVGFPIAIWIVVRFSTYAEPMLQGLHSSVRGVTYVYLFLVIALIFRGTIHACRWAFPVTELKGCRSKK